MLTEQQLKEFSVKFQTSLINVVREYVQNLFLHYFYSFKESEAFLFKGGTALRILYRSPRFSEDLDFSCKQIIKEKIEDLIQETIIKISMEGIEVDVKESKETTGGFLAIIAVKLLSHDFEIFFEASSRKKKSTGQLVLVENPFIDSYTVMSLKREELINEKIGALLQRMKPRDFFDLYFMLRANLLPDKIVLKKVLPIIEKSKINFKSELSQFLPQSYQRL